MPRRPVSPTHRRAHAVPVSHQLRSHRRHVAAWSLAQGRPVDRDALAAVLNCGADHSRPDSPNRWTTDRVAGLLWEGVLGWCRSHGVAPPPPADVRNTLLTYLRYLGAHQLFAPGSDRPRALRDVADSVLTAGEQHPSRHPAAVARVWSLRDRH